MIRLRLQRKGRKKRPYYHIVVADKRSPRDGRIIEQVGRFDNVSENKQLLLDEERIIHWLKIGAQPSDTVRNLLKGEGILYKMHLIRWGKSEEEIEAALSEWREQRKSTGEKKVSRKEKQKSLLEAEEKEYKKQLEQKAAEAAKEVEKAKAEAKAEAEKKEKEEAEPDVQASDESEETEDVATEEEKAETAADTEEAKSTTEEEKPAEAEASAAEDDVEEKADEEKKEVEAKEEAPPAEEEEEPDTEEKAELKTEDADAEEEKEEAEPAGPDQKSTDMNANEAIDIIKDTPLEELEGFVPEDEERVTVRRAWESKQSD